MRIRVDLDLMATTAARLSAFSDALDDAGYRLGMAWRALSATWSGQGKARVEAQYLAARRALWERSEKADLLARWLRRRVTLFEDADTRVLFILPGLPIIGEHYWPANSLPVRPPPGAPSGQSGAESQTPEQS